MDLPRVCPDCGAKGGGHTVSRAYDPPSVLWARCFRCLNFGFFDESYEPT